MISIIITTYKREAEILERAIKSAISQTIEDKEIIVVNDFPEYKEIVEAVVDKYPEVQLISHSSREGACKSRNDGAAIAKGEYLAFLDDDDEWENDKLDIQKKAALQYDADLVYCGGIGINDITGETRELDFIKPCLNDDYYKILLSENIIGGCSFPLLSRRAFSVLGGFDEELQASQDLELWLRFSKSYKIHYIDKKLVIYHLGNISISTNIDKKMQGYRRLYNKHVDEYRENPQSAYKYLKMVNREAIMFSNKEYIKEVIRYSKDYSLSIRIKLLVYTCINYIYKHTIKRSELRVSR